MFNSVDIFLFSLLLLSVPQIYLGDCICRIWCKKDDGKMICSNCICFDSLKSIRGIVLDWKRHFTFLTYCLPWQLIVDTTDTTISHQHIVFNFISSLSLYNVHWIVHQTESYIYCSLSIFVKNFVPASGMRIPNIFTNHIENECIATAF